MGKQRLVISEKEPDKDRGRHPPKQARRDLESLVRLTDEHRREEIKKFQSNGSNVHVVELRHTSHHCFVQRPTTVFHIIAAFLTSPAAYLPSAHPAQPREGVSLE